MADIRHPDEPSMLLREYPCLVCGAARENPLDDCPTCGWTVQEESWVAPAPRRYKPE